MYFIKKRRNKPLYKKFLPLKKNIQNPNKFLNLKKKKWQKFRSWLLKFKKKKFYDPTSYLLFNFKNFFSRKFKNNLLNKQRLSLFYGTLRKSYLKKIVKLTLTEFKALKKHPTILFIQKLEARLDTTLYRTHFFYSFKNARQSISHKKIFVNNKTVQSNSYLLKKGDLVTFNKDVFTFITLNILKSNLWPTPPKHLYINYKTFQILVIEDINYSSYLTYYHFWIDLSSFIKFYER